jgi:YVTN family beta-propeller protein
MGLRVVARARTGSQPKSVIASPEGDLVYVCNFGRPDRENVTIHDARTLERVGVIEFEGNAVEAAFSPDGRTLYVSNFRRHVIEVIDVASRSVRAEIAVGTHPKTIVVSPDGSLLYVANWGGRQVSVVDAERGVELRRLSTGVHPRGMTIRPDGRLLVASFDSHYIQEFDAGGHRELRRFPACQYPRHLVLGADTTLLFVTCTLGSIGWYDLETTERLGLAGVGRNPRSLDLSANGRWAATADFGLGAGRTGSVSVVDLASERHRTTMVTGAERFVGLSIHPGDELVIYATSWDSNEVIALVPGP